MIIELGGAYVLLMFFIAIIIFIIKLFEK